MNFNTSGVQEAQGTESTFIKPGIVENNTIDNITADSSGADPYMEVSFVAEGKTASGRFYLPEGKDDDSKKNWNSNVARLKHMATKVVTAEEFDAAASSSTNYQQWAQNMTTLLKGKPFRMKYSGKRMPGKDGKPDWDLATVPYQRFAESMEIPREKTTLKYDPTNKYDYKPLPTATPTEVLDKLPF